MKQEKPAKSTSEAATSVVENLDGNPAIHSGSFKVRMEVAGNFKSYTLSDQLSYRSFKKKVFKKARMRADRVLQYTVVYTHEGEATEINNSKAYEEFVEYATRVYPGHVMILCGYAGAVEDAVREKQERKKAKEREEEHIQS